MLNLSDKVVKLIILQKMINSEVNHLLISLRISFLEGIKPKKLRALQENKILILIRKKIKIRIDKMMIYLSHNFQKMNQRSVKVFKDYKEKNSIEVIQMMVGWAYKNSITNNKD